MNVKNFKQSQQQQQNSNNTTANSIVGSPDYMALEVLEGKIIIIPLIIGH